MRQTHLRAALALATLTLLAACGDARLDKLSLGISKDSAAAAMGEAPHTTITELTGGKVWDVQFYARSAVGAKDSVAWRAMSPVVFIDHKVVGWGWSWWGDAAKKQGIAMPAK
jgi:hypothetical protein